MNADEIMMALDLPSSCRVDQRIPKTVLLANAATTAADRKSINEDLEEARWIASLKPETIALAPSGGDCPIVEIAVITAQLRSDKRAARLRLLIHRAIHPAVLLIEEISGRRRVSVAEKRTHESDPSKVVLREDPLVAPLPDDQSALCRRAAADLGAVYAGFMDAVCMLHGSDLGLNLSALSAEAAIRWRIERLSRFNQIVAQIEGTRRAARKATQMNRRAELNESLAALRREQADLAQALTEGADHRWTA